MARNQQIHSQIQEPAGLYALQMIAPNQAIFYGEQENHILIQLGQTWQCDCESYATCSHTTQCEDCEHTFALKHYLTVGNLI